MCHLLARVRPGGRNNIGFAGRKVHYSHCSVHEAPRRLE